MIQVRMLLDEGADKSLVDLQGMTAKDHAKEKECVTIIGKKHGDSLMVIILMASKTEDMHRPQSIPNMMIM